jgi:hypothetical protein
MSTIRLGGDRLGKVVSGRMLWSLDPSQIDFLRAEHRGPNLCLCFKGAGQCLLIPAA